MSSSNSELETMTPVEQQLGELQAAELQLNENNETEEIVDYLLYTIRLAKKKTKSNKLRDVVKIKWAKVAVDASKTLLFSGVLDKKIKREVSGFEALFLSVIKEKAVKGDNLSDDQDRLAME